MSNCPQVFGRAHLDSPESTPVTLSWLSIDMYIYSVIFCCVYSCHVPSATAMYSSNCVAHVGAVNEINAVWSKHILKRQYQRLLYTV